MKDILKEIAISDITTNPNQPRQIFKEDDIQSLAQSIADNGLIQPIVVRPSDIIGYELIAGERRLRAHQYLGKTTIKALITEASYQESMKQALVENLQRADLNPIEEAKAYQNILDKLSLTHQELADLVSKSRPYISNQIRLLQLSPSLQDAIIADQISPGHARLILALPKEKQDHWFQKIIQHQWSVHHLEKELKKQSQRPKTQLGDPFKSDIEKELQKTLGLPIHISGFQQKKGQITISFQNEEEFNRVINMLK